MVGPNVDLVELPVSWILDDFPYFEHVVGDNTGLAPASQVAEIWRGEFHYALRNVPGGLYSLTMHPQVIGRGHRLMMLDGLITEFKAAGDVTFTTLGAYAEAWRRANPLADWVRSDAPQAQYACGRQVTP